MILPIYIYGNEALRGECAEATKNIDGLNELIDNMFDTMKGADGVGLSANQVGQSLRLFVCDVEDFADQLGTIPPGDPYRRVFINPEIIDFSEDTEPYTEGCLSLPGINEAVTRPISLTLRYTDRDWQEHTHRFEGFWARVIQHEYDHIQGKVFTDRLAPLRRTMLKGKLTGLARGEHKAGYRCKQ